MIKANSIIDYQYSETICYFPLVIYLNTKAYTEERKTRTDL